MKPSGGVLIAEVNSIGNLVLHLSGNLRHWVVSGVGGAPSERNRDAEFDPNVRMTKRELFAILEQAVQDADEVLAKARALDTLMTTRKSEGGASPCSTPLCTSPNTFRCTQARLSC